MKKPKINKFSHIKIVFAGLLSTKSLVRGTADLLYRADYDTPEHREDAVMAYLHSLGVPPELDFDSFSTLFEAVFPPKVKLTKGMKSPFPIDIDYDQDNCQYSALIAGAAELDVEEGKLLAGRQA